MLRKCESINHDEPFQDIIIETKQIRCHWRGAMIDEAERKCSCSGVCFMFRVSVRIKSLHRDSSVRYEHVYRRCPSPSHTKNCKFVNGFRRKFLFSFSTCYQIVTISIRCACVWRRNREVRKGHRASKNCFSTFIMTRPSPLTSPGINLFSVSFFFAQLYV